MLDTDIAFHQAHAFEVLRLYYSGHTDPDLSPDMVRFTHAIHEEALRSSRIMDLVPRPGAGKAGPFHLFAQAAMAIWRQQVRHRHVYQAVTWKHRTLCDKLSRYAGQLPRSHPHRHHAHP